MEKRLKIAFFTPFLKGNRGNATTAKRIVSGLRKAGADVLLFAYEEEELTSEKLNEIQEASIFHILHISRFKRWKDKNKFHITKPFLLTNGGTDINHDFEKPSEVKGYKKFLEDASAITVFTEDGKKKVGKTANCSTIKTIPQSVWFPSESSSQTLPLQKGYPNILLPAGLRKVKDIFFLENEISRLKETYKGLNFVIAGTVIEQEIYEELLTYKHKNPWVTFYKDVPLEEMSSLYSWADIVLNTSISEGQSSSILEALLMNCIVIARRNAGNESIITNGYNGLLYSSREEFMERTNKLLVNKAEQETLLKNGKKYVEDHHSHEKEIQSYISLYKEILAKG